ncbi:unnamed protein product, partial [Allacma fusca]
RSLTVFRGGKHGLLVRGDVFDSSFMGLNFNTTEDASKSLNCLENLTLCKGLPLSADILRINTRAAVFIGNFVFSNNCQKLDAMELCEKCKSLNKYLNLRIKFLQHRSKTTFPPQQRLQQKLRNTRKQISRLIKKAKSWRESVSELRSQLLSATEKDLLEKIDTSNLADNLKLTIRTAIKTAKAKSQRGHRYESDWLLNALLLKIKSPKGYRFLRENKLLPLPHESSLKQLIAGLPCEFGYSNFIFDSLRKQMENLPERDRHGVLLLDEMKIKESLQFKKHSQTFEGFIDFGDYTGEYLCGGKTRSFEVADHALVLMFRSINSNWAQPVACFASKNSAPGEILAKLAISCILKLEEAGAFVDAIICDGATSNKKTWKTLGVQASSKVIQNKIIHPCDGARFLYFLCDVPHLIKCIRNYMMTAVNATFQGKPISFHFYKSLFEEDNKRLLKAVPKLTSAHIMPDN